MDYRLELFFLTLPTPETAIERVALRVRQGGHDVAESVFRRRFAAGIDNFHKVYKGLVDAWALYDNAGTEPKLLDWGE